MAGELVVRETAPAVLTLTLDRPERQNSLTEALVSEIAAALDRAERTPACRMVVLEGRDGVFCTGMDFEEAVGAPSDGHGPSGGGGESFLALLKRLTAVPRVVVSVVDGRAAGGGVGLAAASDLVLATPVSRFSLPEALWGLLPCCVLPFLIRRVGFQRAYAMALSTLPVDAGEAERCGLADRVAETPADELRRLAFRLSKLEPETIGALKRYAGRLWPLTRETEEAALGELARLMSSPDVQRNLSEFVTRRRYPWEP